MTLAQYHFILPGKFWNALTFLADGTSVLTLYSYQLL